MSRRASDESQSAMRFKLWSAVIFDTKVSNGAKRANRTWRMQVNLVFQKFWKLLPKTKS